MRTFLTATLLFICITPLLAQDSLTVSRDTSFTLTRDITITVDTTGTFARGKAVGYILGRASVDSAGGYMKGYTAGFAARPLIHDTVTIRKDSIIYVPQIVYMVPTDTMIYVNTSGALPASGFMLPKGAQITSRTYNSTGKTVTLSYIYPKYIKP